MTLVGRRFALSDSKEAGICCRNDGVFVGGVPLLQHTSSADGLEKWQPRPLPDLNLDLSKRYRLPIEFAEQFDSLRGIARALSCGDLLHAQIATLHLRIPNPPTLTKFAHAGGDVNDLARQLRASGLLKIDWDPAKHPRWPAGSPGSVGGEFAPADGGVDSGSGGTEPHVPPIPAQVTIPAPLDLFGPRVLPFPYDVLPPPLIAPDINPRDAPKNPYPDRPECEEEWAEAARWCQELLKRNWRERDDYGRMGRTFYECVKGRVSAACGGNST
jgi:hypothetical protein